MAVPARTPARPVTARRTEELLRRCRELIRPELESAVAQLPGPSRETAGHALGRPAPGGPPGTGRDFCPALAVLAAEAVGGSAGQAVPGAVAVELVHAFTLAPGGPGTGPAVPTGDALLALALNVLVRHARRDRREDAMGLLCQALSALLRGQARDLAFAARPWRGAGAVTPEEYRAAARDSTGALSGCAAALGALLAGGDERCVARLATAGRQFGLALRISDDLLGLWGDPARTGGPAGGGLSRGGKSLPVLLALAAASPAAVRLAALLDDAGTPEPEAVPRALRLIEEAGGRARATAEARAALARAGRALDGLPLRPRIRRELAALADYAVARAG
ncbi:polyprenyl synthetase family protein [Streptomyces aidingensis]|uniref:Geranylgeranyl diphosphate synthase, type I n=1 Tax=Streptomyces aidingensis TaxID=910347 RepID=A0A1I1SQF3_9ACTN|nr:class 1 isoprenoid biosynthesis enzyme [Streptomyces aidingensis]SFD45290.1 geranylgeranyl diphosphate synthase, type I [Streptomyces aidingensis]